MKKRAIFLIALAGLLAGCAETTSNSVAGANFGEVVVFLASDSMVGPSTADAATAARYYCSARGKLAALQSRERPQEMQHSVLSEYALLTYRCYSPGP